MNWNKVINVFILIFIVVNMLLFAYQKSYESKKYTLPDEKNAQLQTTLNNKGIIIYDFNAKYYPMYQLQLNVPQNDKEQIVNNILIENYRIQIDPTTLGERVYTEDESLIFYVGEQEGYIYYNSENSHYIPEDMTIDNVYKVIDEFAKDLFGDDINMVVTHRTSIEDTSDRGYRIEMNEVFGSDNNVVFQSVIKLHITEKGIKEALAVRYIPVDYIGDIRNIYPFDEALYSLMYFIEDERKTNVLEENIIRNIEVGYYFVDLDSKRLSYQLDPHYRIIFKNGETYYVNAYTNIVIKP